MMEGIAWLVAVVLSLSIGSFINVVIYRLPLQILHSNCGLNLGHPRSHCTECKVTLRWRDIIPVISWIVLRGQCRGCRHAISPRYPLVEFSCAVGSLGLIALIDNERVLIATLLLFWSLMTLSIIDWDHLLLPDAITLPLLWSGLFFSALEWIPGPLKESLLGVLIGYGSLWLISYLYHQIKGVSALGKGDIKLAAALGAWLGYSLLPWMLIIASGSAMLAILSAKICQHRDLHQPFAFGPWIALAGITLFICRII